MTIYVVGGRGRLGRAIASEYADTDVVVLDRSIYDSWSQSGADEKISRYFAEKGGSDSTIFVAAGLLDPALPSEVLFNVNFHLPKNIIAGATRLGMKVVTFGSVMEHILKSGNGYIQSKSALGDYIADSASYDMPALHLRIHTLFGSGEPAPFMFLGQMLRAIRESRPFFMTSGRQLREYHHEQDEAAAIRHLASVNTFGVLDLNHGQPVSLKEIANAVFASLGRIDSLHLGALPEPKEENYEKTFRRTEGLGAVEFRESLPAIIDYLSEIFPSPAWRKERSVTE